MEHRSSRDSETLEGEGHQIPLTCRLVPHTIAAEGSGQERVGMGGSECDVGGSECDVGGAKCDVGGAECDMSGPKCEVGGAKYDRWV